MLQTVIPQGYAPRLNLYDTQKAIGLLKRLFEDTLGGALHLRRCPLRCSWRPRPSERRFERRGAGRVL